MRDSKEFVNDFMKNFQEGKLDIEREINEKPIELTQEFVDEQVDNFGKILSLKIVKDVLNKGKNIN